MHLIAGLGNPGRQYERTRHNLGFLVADRLRESAGWPAFRAKLGGLLTGGDLGGHPVTLLKPQGFMNLSGDCVQPVAAFFKVPIEQIVVVHDELDLPWKEIRIKVAGGHGGHNGLRSLIERLGSAGFVRVRIGIGKPPQGFAGSGADWVLSAFDPVEKAELAAVVQAAAAATCSVVTDGAATTMNRLNRRSG